MLGTLSIIGGAKMATILMVMGLPLMDFAWQVFRRTREGRNPMSGDRGHLHFRLLDHGVDQRIVGSLYYVFCGFFGALTLLLESAVFKAIALGVMVALLIASFALIARMPQPASSSGIVIAVRLIVAPRQMIRWDGLVGFVLVLHVLRTLRAVRQPKRLRPGRWWHR
ncbi:MAG: hypothetical protein HND48_11125 [Chloroflexi bacterium]|nr:hypothetical protein [Chloroflexota bacterium]